MTEATNNNNESYIDDIMKTAIMSAVVSKKEEGMAAHKNLAGAIAGVAVGVGLELASPTGSIGSAITAGVAGGLLTYALKDTLEMAPQMNCIAVCSGLTTATVSMSMGRLAADYFPGNLD